MPNRTALSSPSEPDQPLIHQKTVLTNTDLESMRRDSIRVLGSVAAALEAAGHQKQTLLAEVHVAQQALRNLANERETAEEDLAAARAELNDVATKLRHAEVERRGILREVEDLRSASVHSHAALAAEIAALEDHVARTPFAPPGARSAAQSCSAGALQQLRWSMVIGLTRTSLQQLALGHPIPTGFGNVATALCIVLFLAMALLLSPLTQVIGGLQLLAVTSGSMAPGIPTGSVVGVRPVPASDLKVGDVITFALASSPDVLVTHRVVSVDMRDGQTMLTTKGDANDSADGLSASATRAVGRVDFALPWLGDVMVWLGSPTAKITIVCLAVLAVGLSLASIRRSTRQPLAVH